MHLDISGEIPEFFEFTHDFEIHGHVHCDEINDLNQSISILKSQLHDLSEKNIVQMTKFSGLFEHNRSYTWD